MSDLIYRDELKKTIKALVSGEVQQLLRIIDGQPKVDAKEVLTEQHGHWVKTAGMSVPEYKGKHYCSVCGRMALMRVCREVLSDYCPSCGARMDGEKNN